MNRIELNLAARVLGASVEQVWSLCTVVGVPTTQDSHEILIDGDALARLYRLLYSSYSPPEAA